MFSTLMLLMLFPAHAETTYMLENYFLYSRNVRSETVINPDNLILQLPSQILAADIRGELKWRGEANQIVFRPRYQAEKKEIVAGGTTVERNESDWDVTDAFWETQLNADFTLTSGLQVYQWGPAELINPSNPIFHFNSRQKSFGYKEKGKVLLRGNYSVGRADTVVMMVEPVSNNEPQWADGDFQAKALLKYEHQLEGTASQFGFVAGQEEKQMTFAGTYFNWQLSEAISFYSDAKATEREIGYRPQAAGAFWDLAAPVVEKEWPVLAVSGLRWEGDFDFRAEYVYNAAGFTEEEWGRVLDSVSNPFNPNYAANLQRFQYLGLELPGRQYAYLSYRVNEPLSYKDLNIYLRDLYSLQDCSSQAQFEFDKALGDALVLFGSVTTASGRKEAEFKLLNTWQSTVGIKWVL